MELNDLQLQWKIAHLLAVRPTDVEIRTWGERRVVTIKAEAVPEHPMWLFDQVRDELGVGIRLRFESSPRGSGTVTSLKR